MTDMPNVTPQPTGITDPNGGLTQTGYRFLQSLEKSGRSTIASLSSLTTSVQALITFIASGAQGSVLYKGASDWAWLPPGTAGQVLQTNGASQNPSWAAQSSMVELDTLTVSSAVSQINFSGTWSDYKQLMLVGVDLSGTATGTLEVLASDDNAASFETFNWSEFGQVNGSAIATSFSQNSIDIISESTIASTTDINFRMSFYDNHKSSHRKKMESIGGVYNAGTEALSINNGYSSDAINSINYIRVRRSSGSIDAGTVTLYGFK